VTENALEFWIRDERRKHHGVLAKANRSQLPKLLPALGGAIAVLRDIAFVD
jgi:hypothetical protein